MQKKRIVVTIIAGVFTLLTLSGALRLVQSQIAMEEMNQILPSLEGTEVTGAALGGALLLHAQRFFSFFTLGCGLTGALAGDLGLRKGPRWARILNGVLMGICLLCVGYTVYLLLAELRA